MVKYSKGCEEMTSEERYQIYLQVKAELDRESRKNWTEERRAKHNEYMRNYRKLKRKELE